MAGVIRGAAERQRLVEEYTSSAMSAKTFSAREGVPVSTLYQWLSDLRATQAPKIARVIRRSAAVKVAGAKSVNAIVLEVGQVRVRVGGEFDEPLLSALLDLLEARQGSGNDSTRR